MIYFCKNQHLLLEIPALLLMQRFFTFGTIVQSQKGFRNYISLELFHSFVIEDMTELNFLIFFTKNKGIMRLMMCYFGEN